MTKELRKYQSEDLLNDFENSVPSAVSADWSEKLFQKISSESNAIKHKKPVGFIAFSTLILVNLVALILFLQPRRNAIEKQHAELMHEISNQFLINTEAQ
jgi:hypothetical protein